MGIDVDTLAGRMGSLLGSVLREEEALNAQDLETLVRAKANAAQALLDGLSGIHPGSISKKFMDSLSVLPEGYNQIANTGDRVRQAELSGKAADMVREYRESIDKYMNLYRSKGGDFREQRDAYLAEMREAFGAMTEVYLLQVREKADANIRGDLSRSRVDINILEKYVIKIQEFEPLAKDVAEKQAEKLRQCVWAWRSQSLIGNRGSFADFGGDEEFYPTSGLLPDDVMRDAAVSLKSDIRELVKADFKDYGAQTAKQQFTERITAICQSACGWMTSHAVTRLEEQAAQYYRDCVQVLYFSFESMLFPPDRANEVRKRMRSMELLLPEEHGKIYMRDILLGKDEPTIAVAE